MHEKEMKRKPWTQEECELLKELYSRTDIFVSAMQRILGRSSTQIYQKAAALGLRRPEEIRVISGQIFSQSEAAKATRFRKGCIPPNKGKRMSPELYAKLAPTMFKKGHTPGNHKPVGSERVNVDGYIERKVAEPNKWECKHRIIWRQAHGDIPKGYNIQFKDGNPLNCTLENLYIISRAEQMQTQNSLMARYPKELQKVIRLRGAVKRQMTLHNKKLNKHE